MRECREIEKAVQLYQGSPRQPTSPVNYKRIVTWRHHSPIVSWTFAMCARCAAWRRSASLKKKRRRARGVIAEARGSLASAANSERYYATGNHRIGDGAQRCRGARLRV